MSEAFEADLKELHDTGQRNVVREVIAGRIIAAAKLGEVTRFACGQPGLLGREANEASHTFPARPGAAVRPSYAPSRASNPADSK